jgi:Lrp/AsnC family leucine-responsive transcriptional regulator
MKQKMPQTPLDAIDLRIVDQLQKDGSLSNVKLAEAIRLSPSPTLARVKALETSGVIQRYVALVDPQSLGLAITVFISVSLERQEKKSLALFEQRMGGYPQVMECYLMSGDADYLLRVVVPDMQSLERFIVDHLAQVPGVSNIKSSFALKQVLYKTALPLPGKR